MEIRIIESPAEIQAYTQWQQAHFSEALWQSTVWQQYQEALGKKVQLYVAIIHSTIVASALVVIDTTSFGLSTWELPRGPLWLQGYNEAALKLVAHILAEAKQTKCLAVYCSPEHVLAVEKFTDSKRLIHPEATSIVDINKSIEEIMATMKPKGRYNCKVALKNKVTVRLSTDVQPFIDLHQVTSNRNAFTKPSANTYKNFLECIPKSFLLYAYIPSNPKSIAGLIGVINGKTGIYYYGASDHKHRALMAPYALQYAAIEHCKEYGCTQYDLFGISPPDSKNHPWSGVTSFKQKFGGNTVLYPPEQVRVLRPVAVALLRLKRQIVRMVRSH